MPSYFCKECGYETNVWAGKCPVCNSWSSFVETTRITKKKGKADKLSLIDIKNDAIPLSKVQVSEYPRIKTGINEFDTVLGGGIVPGMVALIGGEPGIGKSTIMMQIALKLVHNISQSKKFKVLYVSGEESPEQIYLRSKRLSTDFQNDKKDLNDIKPLLSDDIFLLCTNDTEQILDKIKIFTEQFKNEFCVVVIDSIQSVYLTSLDNYPGSVTQIRECAGLFTQTAKKLNIPIFMIGHVNKDGFVAGPKILEHIVDTVLYFEGEVNNQFKILRTTKNRFGSTNEIGLFEMTDSGLKEVINPSEIFIMHRNSFPGTAISCVVEGTRAFLIEIQALVTPTSYGNAQRVSVGFDQKRLSLLLAVIDKHLGINMKEFDVFINLTGGIKIIDTSVDLAIISAIISSIRNVDLPEKSLFMGEIALNGDVRNINQLDKRLKEAIKLGYQRCYLSSNFNKLNKLSKDKIHKIEIIKMSCIKEIISIFL
ncbi:MAG: DNA repair protein RadA [Candidatus Cloacimonetes bacterium]|nr:DNA repair protein RadA [Candidatus Cloacimonadota bacterium]